MEFFLTLVMCSGVANVCIDPFTVPKKYDSIYDCMVEGYALSGKKIAEIGPKDVNGSKIYIKFECNEIIIPPQKPRVET